MGVTQMKKLARAAIVAAATALTTAASASELIDATDPTEILNIARGFGSANLDKDSAGDPRITGRIDGYRYTLFFYGCTGGEKCTNLTFNAGWDLETFDLTRINDWNRERRYGRAYLDNEGDPIVEMDVNIEFGVSRTNFDDNFALWSSILKDFAEFVDP